MPFLDSLDIANSALQHCGEKHILEVDEDSKNNKETAFAYDKMRPAELRRNVWRFSTRRAVLRPIETTTMLLDPDEWDAEVTYLPGSIVKDENGVLWTSTLTASTNLNQEPGETTVWDSYFGPMTVHEWDEDVSYSSGELVYAAGANAGSYVIYMSLQNENEDNPETATAYSATTTYNVGDRVSSGGFYWRSLIELNLGTTPAEGPLDWDQTATYASAATVTGSDGYIYSSVAGSNLGFNPVGDGGVHWTNTTVPKAWTKVPTLHAASIKWLPIFAAMRSFTFQYPTGAGPASQRTTRNVYRLPSGFMREAPQDPKAGAMTAMGAPSGLTYNDWTYEGNFFTTASAGPILFRFVADISRVTDMDPLFAEGLACRIAYKVCETLTGSTAKLSSIGASYQKFMTEARMVNGIETGPTEPPEDEYLTVRY